MNDFWISCGHHLLDRDAGGGLQGDRRFSGRLYLARPGADSRRRRLARSKRALHAALLADPRMPVAVSHIAAIADADARENWQTADRLPRPPAAVARRWKSAHVDRWSAACISAPYAACCFVNQRRARGSRATRSTA